MLLDRFFRLFRTRLAILVLLVGLPAVGLVIHANLEQRRIELARARESALASVRIAAVSQRDFIKDTRQLLMTLAQIQFLVLSTNRQLCELHFTNLRQLAPDYANFGLVETNGIVFCSADATNHSANVSNRAFFQRVMRSKDFAVGDFVIGRVTGQRMLAFGCPVFDGQGNLRRVISASMNLGTMSRGLKEVKADGPITIIDRMGTILATQANPEGMTGKPVAGDPVVRQILASGQSTFETRGADGMKQLYAATPVLDGEDAAMYVYMGVPLAACMAHANTVLAWNIGLLAAVAIVVFMTLWVLSRRFLLQPVRALSAAAEKVARGELSARCGLSSGPIELIQLGAAFDEMAARLEQRGQELSRVYAELETRVSERTAELEAANRELEAFTYSVSHDLRAPLRHICGYAEVLVNDHERSIEPEIRKLVTSMRGAAARMGSLIDDLLLFSTMGRTALHRVQIDLHELIQEVRDLLPVPHGRQIEWKTATSVKVSGDRGLLRQVFYNLLSNAIKYTRTRETAIIEIGSRLEGGEVVVYVRDNGVGFNPAYAHKLFGVFERLHHHNEFEGTGIGLANVRRIISRHNGRTWAEGHPGKGATFFFSVPNQEQRAYAA
jgi:signal transduction histidine kinase